MKKILTMTISLLTVFCTLVCITEGPAFYASAETTSGQNEETGETVENCTACFWNFDEETGILELTGSGAADQGDWGEYKERIRKVIVSDGITEISNGAFYEFPSLEEVSLPDSVTRIGTQAFYYCQSLRLVEFGNGLREAGPFAFEGCIELEKALLPETLEKLGQGAFMDCRALAEVTLPDTLTTIKYDTFNNCIGLKKLRLPSGLTSIGNDAFLNVMADIEIPDSVFCADSSVNCGRPVHDSEDPRENHICYAGHHAQGTDSDECISETIKFRDDTLSVSANAFITSERIRCIIVPESVVYIGWNALSVEKLEKIAIYNPDCFIYDDACVIGSDAVIYGHKGSTAEAYAKKYGRKFCLIDCFEGHKDIISGATFEKDGRQASVCTACGGEVPSVIPKVESVKLTSYNVIEHDRSYHPQLDVRDSEGNRLIQNMDYIVTDDEVDSENITYTVKLIGSRYSGSGTYQYKLIPDSVSGLKTSARTDSSVTLEWDPVDDASTYRIYRYSESDDSYNQIGVTSRTTYRIKELRAGENYTFYVLTTRSIKGRRYSAPDYVRIDTYTALSPVKNLKAASTTSSVKLSWKATAGADGYRIYRYNSQDSKYEKLGSTSKTSYTVKNLKPGKTYSYYVKAYRTENGKTFLSSTYTKVKTATKPTAPKTPSLTTRTGKLTAKWSKVSGATGYQFCYATEKNGTYHKLSTTKLSFTKSKLTSGKTCYVKIRAYKTVDGVRIYSAYSPVKAVKVK